MRKVLHFRRVVFRALPELGTLKATMNLLECKINVVTVI
jgi:hypothetical protein